MVSMNRLSPEKRKAVVACLVEGNSIRATCRMTGVAKNTVVKLLVDLGTACSEYQDRFMRDVAKRLHNRVQLTTDAHRPYLTAVQDAFAGDVDYAQLVKLYGSTDFG